MHKDGEEIHESDVEAKAGVNVKGMTTVLTVSTALVIVAFVAVYFFWM
ncbi:MAG: hypothetical protein V4659_01315 [Pseudomonadota bacterium]